MRVALTILGLSLAVYTLQAGFALGGVGSLDFVAPWAYGILSIGAGAVCLARVVLVKAERAAWTCFFVGLVSLTVADAIVLSGPKAVSDSPLYWLTELLYLTMYPVFYCGIVLLMRARLRPFRASLWLDGLAGGPWPRSVRL